ncbi:ankyrin repeat and SOCS box protein 8-like [Pseudophryne corroboree]|uniref:ankyrin repeat and SOCS box protein 8-like n=1 Tax=Pseudophryne corroboree TaxID=495146 RepID=UPI0030821D0F
MFQRRFRSRLRHLATMLYVHTKCSLSERLMRAISGIDPLPGDTVASLIRKGANVNRPGYSQMPLHSACVECNADYVELLLRSGACVHSLDVYQRTALHCAAEKDETCVKILLEYSADPNAPDGNQDTPLHWAAFKNKVDCVQALLEGGAKVNARDHNLDTPLSLAAMKGNLESVRSLLEYGALPDTMNRKGYSPAGQLVTLLGRGLAGEREEECLALLHRACVKIRFRREGGLPHDAARVSHLWQRLAKLMSDPGTLKALARRVVRGSLGECLLSRVVPELPIPKTIQGYVLLVE